MAPVRERVVIETNVFIRGLLSTQSPPARCIEHVVASCQPVASEATLRELMQTLLSPKLDRYFSQARREELRDRAWPDG